MYSQFGLNPLVQSEDEANDSEEIMSIESGINGPKYNNTARSNLLLLDFSAVNYIDSGAAKAVERVI